MFAEGYQPSGRRRRVGGMAVKEVEGQGQNTCRGLPARGGGGGGGVEEKEGAWEGCLQKTTSQVCVGGGGGK